MANQFLYQVLVYTLVVFGVVYWTGKSAEKTVYDNYRVELEGVSLSLVDPQKTALFYQDVLQFRPLSPASPAGNVPAGVSVPGGQKLFFRKSTENHAPRGSAVVILRVKNGFNSLHKRLSALLGSKQFRSSEQDVVETIEPGRISEVINRTWGKEFVVADTEGNRIVFFQSLRRSGSRY